MTTLTSRQWVYSIVLAFSILGIVAFPLWQLSTSEETYTIRATSYGDVTDQSEPLITVDVTTELLDEPILQWMKDDTSFQKQVYVHFQPQQGMLVPTAVTLHRPTSGIFLLADFYTYRTADDPNTFELTLHVGYAIETIDRYDEAAIRRFERQNQLVPWRATLRYNNGHALVIALQKM